MTAEERADQLARQAVDELSLPADQLDTLRERIAEQIREALAEENDACARIVEEKLRARILYATGIPGAIRERVKPAK
jgi:hypothetical protein